MEQSVFRQKSMERVSSPEQLSDYLHVTTPSVWIVLAAVVLALAGLLVWSGLTTVESYAAGTAQVENGVLTLTFDDGEKATNVEVGMNVRVGEMLIPVLSVGQDESGSSFAVAQTNLPDGLYEARVGYSRTRIIELLFN